jgi:hypothetical protein
LTTHGCIVPNAGNSITRRIRRAGQFGQTSMIGMRAGTWAGPYECPRGSLTPTRGSAREKGAGFL